MNYNSLAGAYDSLQSEVDYTALADCCGAMFKKAGRQVKTVLDLACGTGTLLYKFAGMGYETIGTDASPEMLSMAAEKALSLPEDARPLLLNQTMEELDLYGTVDAAVCTLDGLNYLDREALAETFRRVSLFLAPGGVFIFDINTLEKFRNMDGRTFTSETEDSLCLWRCWFDEDEGECGIDMDVFSREGRLWSRTCEDHMEYYHSERDVKTAMQKAGFADIIISDGYPGALADGEGTRLVFLCKK